MSASHLLSETEAQRFAEYFERDAHDRDAMAKQRCYGAKERERSSRSHHFWLSCQERR